MPRPSFRCKIMTVRVVGYVRVSSRRQAEEGLSLENQTSALEEWCRRSGAELVRVFADDESAKTADRTELKEMLAFCRRRSREIDFVLVNRVDRFIRSQHDYHALRAILAASGISLRSTQENIDDGSMGRFLGGILAAFAELDNDQRAERVLGGMKAAANRGRWVWKAPHGYHNIRNSEGDKTIEIDPDVAPMVREAFEMAARHNSLPEIRRHLTAKGFTTARGGRFTTSTLREMLCREVYCGRLVIPKWGIDRAGDWEPIVDRGTWLKAQTALDRKGPTAVPKNRARPDFPLRRFIRCESCGQPVTASYSRGRHGKRYAYYHCAPSRPGCLRVPRAKMEGAFLDQLRDLRPRDDLLAIWRDIVRDVWATRKAELENDLKIFERRVVEVNKRRKSLTRAFVFDKAIEQSDYDEFLAELKEDQFVAENALHEAQIDDLDIEATLTFAEKALMSAASIWVEASLEQRQRFQALLFPEGLIYSRESGFRTPTILSLFSTLRDLEREKPEEGVQEGLRTPESTSVFSNLRKDELESEGLVDPVGFEPMTSVL